MVAYRGDWGAAVSNLAFEAHGWGNHADGGYLTSYTETDPIFTAVSNEWWTAIQTGAGGGNLSATNLPTAGQMLYAGDDTLTNLYFAAAPAGGGISTKSIGGAATDWAWSDSASVVARTTGGVTFLEFPLDLGGTVNGVNLLGVDGIAVTQVVIKATAYTAGGTVGLLTGWDGVFVTNEVTLATYPTVTVQAVSISLPALTGTTNALFQWGVDSTNNTGTASGNAWVELFQARGAW